MRRLALASAATIALLGLSACGQSGRDEAAEANEVMAGDSNTMGEAVSDVDAAQDEAFANAEAGYTGNLSGLDTSVPDGNEVE